MKVLSCIQPWATLIVKQYKLIETRSWKTDYRGTILIHASKGIYYGPKGKRISCEAVTSNARNRWPIDLPVWQDLPKGAIIGQADLYDVIPTDASFLLNLTTMERAFGDYSPGRYAWLLRNAKIFDEPIPVNGKLQLWDFDLCAHMQEQFTGK